MSRQNGLDCRPNIVFILCDDLGARDLGCYGSSFYETPHLDQLAADGTRFTDAYAASPVCSPTRASLMSGQYPARVGITNFIAGNAPGRFLGAEYLHALPRNVPTVASALKGAGYRTIHAGKWHLGDSANGGGPCDFGFDVNHGGGNWGHPRKGFFSPYQFPESFNLPDGPEGEYLTDRITDEAIGEVRRSVEEDKPFFLHLSHYAVHTPIQAPADLVEKYRQKAKRLRLDEAEAIVSGEPMPCLHQRGKRVRRRIIQSDPTYAAMIENLDTNTGRLLATLDQLGIAENTLVIFTSDNGGLATAEGSPTCNAPLAEGKGWAEEGGVREPLIARWPGVVPAGRLCAEPVTTPDFLPTLLELAGASSPEGHKLDGQSLVPLLRDPTGATLEREAIYFHYPHYSNQGGRPHSAVRSGRWKLIESLEGDQPVLFNLEADVSEAQDVAAEQTEIVERLTALLHRWRDDVGAKLPRPNPQYEAMLRGEIHVDGQGNITAPEKTPGAA